MHRLVQDFARRAMIEEGRRDALRETMGWIDAAFVGDPLDARTWPILDPIAPHALAVARRGDEANLAEPTRRLFNQFGLHLQGKARYIEAEQYFRSALRILKALGTNYVLESQAFNNLGVVLKEMKRYDEAESMYRHVLAMVKSKFERNRPDMALYINNFAELLREMGRPNEAVPLYWRALAIFEASVGVDDRMVPMTLSNLGLALLASGHANDAEPLFRRWLIPLSQVALDVV